MKNHFKQLYKESFSNSYNNGKVPLSTNGRIDFFDLAKGICIILVVLYHFSEKWFNLPNFVAFRVPLFFVLSGYFFKSNETPKDFLKNKTHGILIPYIFWLLIGIAVSIILDKTEILDCNSLLEFQDLNGPIWFLLALFDASLIFYCLTKVFSGIWLFLIVVALSFLGCYIHYNVYNIHYEFDRLAPNFPYLYMGYFLKGHLSKILKYSKLKLLISSVICILMAYSIFYITPHMEYLTIKNSDVNLMSFFNGTFYIIGIFLACGVIRWIPIISYMGKYSLIVLCTHWPIMRIMYGLTGGPVDNPFFKFVFLFTLLLLTWLSIPICLKLIPYFVGRKNIFKIKLFSSLNKI